MPAWWAPHAAMLGALLLSMPVRPVAWTAVIVTGRGERPDHQTGSALTRTAATMQGSLPRTLHE
jgi:hypothetical protein